MILDDEASSYSGSGNTSEPHLHFQVQNTKNFYFSIGLPIRFTSIRKSPIPNHERSDPRQAPNDEDLDDCYIARGLAVQNQTKS
ncbi:MAG: M23 family peptidase [[Clostridium] sporosphaeroides]|uniref:M23 family peptidase n=1 Tax=Faecalispora sporosphaeroides TaxID=1549 RepID=A0A928KWM5_9FIRM|nr:M23 family peptidase [Faecalispora sporosphaeroides]